MPIVNVQLNQFLEEVLNGMYGDSSLSRADISAFWLNAYESEVEDLNALYIIWHSQEAEEEDTDIEELETLIYSVAERVV